MLLFFMLLQVYCKVLWELLFLFHCHVQCVNNIGKLRVHISVIFNSHNVPGE